MAYQGRADQDRFRALLRGCRVIIVAQAQLAGCNDSPVRSCLRERRPKRVVMLCAEDDNHSSCEEESGPRVKHATLSIEAGANRSEACGEPEYFFGSRDFRLIVTKPRTLR